MFGRKKEKTVGEIKNEKISLINRIICPHCEKGISDNQRLPAIVAAQGGWIIGCPHCKKVIGCTAEW